MNHRSPVDVDLPRELYAEVTNRCNSLCQTCIRTFEQLEPLHDLTLDEFRRIVDPFPALDRVVLHGIGEPLLNAELPAMVRHVKARHPSAVVLFNSNAVLLDREWQQTLIDVQLDELRVSLDAATAPTYARVRGIDAFDRVVENVRSFAGRLQGRECPRLSLWSMALRDNLGELPALVDLAARIGVPEVYVQRLVLIDRGLAREEQSLYKKLRAQEEAALAEAARRAGAQGVALSASGLSSPRASLGGQDAPPSRQPWAACYRLWKTTYITANGNVLPCCISPFSTTDYAGLILGNVFQTPFAEIWNGDRTIERRRALYTQHPLHPCERCGQDWTL